MWPIRAQPGDLVKMVQHTHTHTHTHTGGCWWQVCMRSERERHCQYKPVSLYFVLSASDDITLNPTANRFASHLSRHSREPSALLTPRSPQASREPPEYHDRRRELEQILECLAGLKDRYAAALGQVSRGFHEKQFLEPITRTQGLKGPTLIRRGSPMLCSVCSRRFEPTSSAWATGWGRLCSPRRPISCAVPEVRAWDDY